MKTRIFIPALFCVVLMACGAPAPSLPATATVIVAPTVTFTASPTPVPFSGAMEAAQSPDMPNLEQAGFLPGSGGSGRNEIITRAGVPEETLVLYENAAKAWAEANGYANPQINYLFDGTSWNMVLRDAATGNIIWSEDGEGALMTYPTIIRVDEQGIHADDSMGARDLEGTKDSKAILVNGFVILLRHPVAINGKQYYSEWFNTTTGEWEKIAEVIAAIPVEANEVTKSELGTIDWSDFSPVTSEERAIINQRVLDAPQLAQNVDSVAPVDFLTNRYPDGTQIVLICMSGVNCAPRYVVSENTPEGTLNMIVWEIITADPANPGKNMRAVFTTAHVPKQDGDTFRQHALDAVRKIGKPGNQITMTLVTKLTDNISPIAKALVELNEARKALEDGKIIQPNGETPVWLTQVSLF